MIMDDKAKVYGVDVSKATLEIGRYELPASQQISNSAAAIAAWLASIAPGSIVAMEATGAYHQLLAHAAHAAGMVVLVLNPKVLKHYARAVGQRGKTDRIDAQLIARYALHERAKLIAWQPPAPGVDALSQLLVRRQALVRARQTLEQSLGAIAILKTEREMLFASLQRMRAHLDLLIAKELALTPALTALHRRLMTIVGVGPVVSAQLVACLARLRFRNARAFIAYTGLDPRPNDSGEHRGTRYLSKHGNALLRCLLFNGAMAAVRTTLFKPMYVQLQARGLASTQAIVVVARKLARIAFAIYQSGQTFDPTKHLKNA
jgi:transposase